MSDDYQPIDCALYSELELWILHRQLLRVHWREAGQDHLATLRPKDLRTEATKEEFLIAEYLDHRPLRLRLDRIVAVAPVALQEEPL